MLLAARPAAAAATQERSSCSPSRRYGAIFLAPPPPRSEMRWRKQQQASSNERVRTPGSDRGAGSGGGDGDLIVGLFTHSLELLIRKARTGLRGSLFDPGWEQKEKKGFVFGEVLGWTRLVRRTSALVLSDRGGWGPTATGGAMISSSLSHSLVMSVYLTLSDLDCRLHPAPAPRARMCAQGNGNGIGFGNSRVNDDGASEKE